MKRLLNLAVLCTVIGLLASPASLIADDLFPYPVEERTLDNGLTVIMVPMPSNGLVSYWSIVRTGSRDEVEAGRTGFAHFFEHMMFRGTDKYPADVYGEVMTSIGADTNAYTSTDITAYHLNFASRDLDKVMDLESDRFQNLKYEEQVFQTEAGAVYGEYRKNRASPFFTLYEEIRKTAFDKHTYGHTTMGYVEDIQGMPQLFDYSKSFFDRFYRPENTLLLIAGDIENDKVLEMANKYYGGWQPGYQAPTVPQEPEQKEEKRTEISYEGSTLPILWLGYKFDAYDPTDTNVVSAFVLSEMLFGQTSDLYKQLVLEEQLVQSISGDPDAARDPGMIDIILQVKDPAKIDDVIAKVDASIAAFSQQPPSQEDLEALQSRLRYSFLMRLDTPSNVASSLARILAVTGEWAAVEAFYATLQSLTPADVQKAAERYLTPQRRTVAVLKGSA